MKKFVKRISLTVGASVTGLLLTTTQVFAADDNLPTGDGLKNWIVTLGGNLLIVILIVGAIINLVRQSWGKMVALLLGGAFVAWIIYFPESVQSVLKALGKLIGQ
ncbi:TcpD family membrane protein [Enterococcus faecalis]|uniref:TcpD family membrane protein n=1 Tax=Enterococcus faecalis TaxID=1351 RepID=UPI001F0615B2|nr:TcpD family membrane protein [Enterococcus faecalis]MCH1672949.1 TcpD family membrane protein [Enterococcus faecalis]